MKVEKISDLTCVFFLLTIYLIAYVYSVSCILSLKPFLIDSTGSSGLFYGEFGRFVHRIALWSFVFPRHKVHITRQKLALNYIFAFMNIQFN